MFDRRHIALRSRFFGSAGILISLAACGGESGPPVNGSVTVTAIMHGGGSDSDGFNITVGSHNGVLHPGTPLTLSDIPPGSFTAQLTGLAAQCSTAADSATVVVQPAQTSALQFAVTCYGQIAFNEAVGGAYEVMYLGADGRIRRLTSGPGNNALKDWSPDGTRVVFETDRNGNDDLYSVRTDGTDLKRLTSDTADDQQPHWSPDGQSIVFHRVPHSGAFTHASLHIVQADGTGERLLVDSVSHDYDATWTPDGKWIVFSCDQFGATANLCAVSPADTGFHGIVFSAGAQHSEASPDGLRVGFQSYDGTQAIWVATLDGLTAKDLTPGLVSFDFGWSPDGSQLVLATYDGHDYQLQRVSRDATGLTPLTLASDEAGDGRWSPDGARIVFYSLRSAQQLWIMKPDGSDQHAITTGLEAKFHPRWNPQATPGQ